MAEALNTMTGADAGYRTRGPNPRAGALVTLTPVNGVACSLARSTPQGLPIYVRAIRHGASYLVLDGKLQVARGVSPWHHATWRWPEGNTMANGLNVAVAWFRAEDYERIRQISGDGMPTTFAEWEAKMTRTLVRSGLAGFFCGEGHHRSR